VEYNCINICSLAKLGSAELELSKFGYNKLLAKGKPDKAYTIKVDYASARAISKIEDAKGTVSVLVAKKAKKQSKNSVDKKKTADESGQSNKSDKSDSDGSRKAAKAAKTNKSEIKEGLEE
jgi:hypothetical protein